MVAECEWVAVFSLHVEPWTHADGTRLKKTTEGRVYEAHGVCVIEGHLLPLTVQVQADPPWEALGRVGHRLLSAIMAEHIAAIFKVELDLLLGKLKLGSFGHFYLKADAPVLLGPHLQLTVVLARPEGLRGAGAGVVGLVHGAAPVCLANAMALWGHFQIGVSWIFDGQTLWALPWETVEFVLVTLSIC